MPAPTYYEFFAGGGMARAGLGPRWRCLFSNDIDPRKAAAYTANWGPRHFHLADVAQLTPSDLPARAHLAWASFPCQDLSLAGPQSGLHGHRSGTFWPFWNLMRALAQAKRAPTTIVLENVCGALTSHHGADFLSLAQAFHDAHYRYGALVIDAAHFLPQSRPRLFLVATRAAAVANAPQPHPTWHPAKLLAAYAKLPPTLKADWIWWNLPDPPPRAATLPDLLEPPNAVPWHSAEQTQRLLSLMSPLHRHRVDSLRDLHRPIYGTVYRRTRRSAASTGTTQPQRAEVRFDGLAGCLRTPVGGSSRQTILLIHGPHTRSRLLSPRETARLMGLPDSYLLPHRPTDAYHLTGDGLAVPAVHFLARHLLDSLA